MLNVLDRHAIGQILRTKDVDAWGVAANYPRLPLAPDYRTAISVLMRLDPLVVRGLRHGPTPDYQQEYLRVNVALIPLAAGVFYPAFGILLNPIYAAAAMGLSSVTVVTNSLRLRGFKPG
jgi:hypothetical protein